MIALLGIVNVLLEYIDRVVPIMPALCSMLLVTYYAFNYAGIIGWGLARGRRPRAPGFLKLFWSACQYACVCVCPPPRPLITSGVIWCDIDRVRLVKQVLRLFPSFNYVIQQFPSIKWMGVAILTQLVVNACQRKLR